MSYWIDEADMFLYVKGIEPDDVHLWRCKKPASSSSSSSSSLVVPMKPDDFEYVESVKNHMELIGEGLLEWDENDYKRLVKYIYEKRLLVNCYGFVIAELPNKADKDGNKTIDYANEEDVPVIYIRSLDVLPLKRYIPSLMEQPIPLRTVKLLGDVNGKPAEMKEDSDVTKLTARVDDLESKNKILNTKVTTLDTNVADLQSKNKNLEAENKTLNSNAKTLEGKVTKLTADLVTQMTTLTALQQEVKKINVKTYEAWMNDNTSSSIKWVGVEGLNVRIGNDPTIILSLGTFTVDESWTNVRARYWYPLNEGGGYTKAVSLEDLTPNKERARFRKSGCESFISKGKTYVLF